MEKETLNTQPDTQAPSCARPAHDGDPETQTIPGTATKSAPKRAPEVLTLDNWQPKTLEWLWEPYVAKGIITTLDGASGAGKTYVALALAASITRGERSPRSIRRSMHASTLNGPTVRKSAARRGPESGAGWGLLSRPRPLSDGR